MTSRPLRLYARSLLLIVAAAGVVAALGYLPTKRVAGAEGVTAMLAGCAITMIASAIGVIPIAGAAGRPSRVTPQVIMVATSVRLVGVLVLAVAAALSGLFERGPLLIWVAVSYLAQLAVDTWSAANVLKNKGTEGS
jgi:hypothetical protein